MSNGVRCWRHDLSRREYECWCDPPVEGDTGLAYLDGPKVQVDTR